MVIDKQTLKDLEIFKSDENAVTLFGFIDKTRTAGGSYCLRQKFLNPPGIFNELKKQQEAVHFFSEMGNSSNLELPFNSHQMKSLEEYISSNINVVENGNLMTCAMFCFVDIEAYRYIKNSLKEIIDFVYTFHKTVDHNGNRIPFLLRKINDDIINLINDPDFKEAVRLKKNDKLLFFRVLQLDRIFRTRLKITFQNIIGWYYEVDALFSMAKTTTANNFQYPVITNEEDSIFQVEGLYHPLLQNAIPYDISLDSDSNFVFLTGPNMAGKTTFLKAAGTAVYLAHLGMGIPAKSARISYLDRLFTSLNITDSITTGYSFFYSEVMRVKQLAESLNRGEKVFSLFDELFRGTNVKDAYDASVMIISGLVGWNRSIFILSSHLWELWEKIKVFPNIKELCFESEIKNGKPVFTYHILQGVSDMRLGMTIIENEKIMDLLNSNENVKN
jgi:DNA mismatch repair ATPase MutS